MPRAPRFKSIALVLFVACQKQTIEERKTGEPAPAPAVTQPARVYRPAPTGEFSCEEVRSLPDAEATAAPETIELREPRTDKTLVLSKTGVIVTFERDAFLNAARCLKLDEALRYIQAETGRTPQTYLYDAFQLSFVAAALLDAGRASVRLEDQKAFQKTIARDAWAEDGCDGRCRSFGRLYRVSEDDPSFFLRITDKTLKR